MRRHGFNRLVGADPFIEADVAYEGGPTLLKRNVSEIEGGYDLIMMHHSFEHLPDPFRALLHLVSLLNAGGCLLIRTPLAGGFAWRTYGTNWVELDPPRHLFVHTLRSLQIIGERAGLVVRDVRYDSSELQFIGSEQYRRDIPLWSSESYFSTGSSTEFSSRDIEAMKLKARELNAAGDGDRGCVYLARPGTSWQGS